MGLFKNASAKELHVTEVAKAKKDYDEDLETFQGPVARSLVSANRWLRGIKLYRFPWYLTLVSTNHASSNPGQVVGAVSQ